MPRILLPLIAYRIVYSLVPGYASQPDEPSDNIINSTRQDIATFGFLMGTFPTAPTVFVFASQYNIAMEVVSVCVCVCVCVLLEKMFVLTCVCNVLHSNLSYPDSVGPRGVHN